MEIKIGADPELFVKRAGQYVTGHGLIKGDKANPYKVEGGAVQVDGHALEFNIDPAMDDLGFVTNITTVMKQLQGMIPDYTLHADPVAQFTKEYLAAQPDEANELGCDPDFDAWNDGRANPRPDGDVDFRTGGGHVHIGWTNNEDIEDPQHREACMMLAKQLDFYLGAPSLFWDNDDKRRKMYGKASCFRVKPYGVEYRSLSNAWLRSEELMRFVFNQALKATKDLMDGKAAYDGYGKVARSSVNECNIVVANSILEVILGMKASDIPDRVR